MDECTHLMRDYLCKNSTAINWGYYAMSEDDLSQALHQLKSFDRPDMYAILKDKIIIIEHFEFDASVCSRKGMKGIKEERLLDHRIFSIPIGNEFHVGKGDYPISLANWQANFDMTFDSHYNKIPAYKETKGETFSTNQLLWVSLLRISILRLCIIMECQKSMKNCTILKQFNLQVKFLHLLIWILSFLVVTVMGGHKYFISIVKSISISVNLLI